MFRTSDLPEPEPSALFLAPVDENQRRQLAALSLQPGWPVLRGVVKQEMERRFQIMARELMRGAMPDVEWTRGFFAGMKFLLDNPEIESRKLDKEFEQRKVSEVDA